VAATRGFGIDIGGSGIKGAVVDLEKGQLIGERFRIDTPRPATPEAVADVVAEVVRTSADRRHAASSGEEGRRPHRSQH
jgi:polyphosphate glucokinase